MSQLSLSCSLSSPISALLPQVIFSTVLLPYFVYKASELEKPTVTSRLLPVVLKLPVQTNKIAAFSSYSPGFFFAPSYFVCQNSHVKVAVYYLKLNSDDFLILSDLLLTNNPIILHCTTLGIYRR
jgi:hypothetical protein